MCFTFFVTFIYPQIEECAIFISYKKKDKDWKIKRKELKNNDKFQFRWSFAVVAAEWAIFSQY